MTFRGEVAASENARAHERTHHYAPSLPASERASARLAVQIEFASAFHQVLFKDGAAAPLRYVTLHYAAMKR